MNDERDVNRLQHDLAQGGRDAVYRAMSFVAREEGPAFPTVPHQGGDTALRQDMLDWLVTHPAAVDIAASYERFCRDWSPVFQDEP